jgi:hypothetical protein
MITNEELRARESEETELPPEKQHLREAWLCAYVKDAYVDQLGLRHYAWVVYDRVIVHITHTAPQWEGYGERFYDDASKIGTSADGRRWRWWQELVAYTGGGSWSVIDGDRLLGHPDAPPNAYWRKPPWSEKGTRVRGYMLEDGTPATRLVEP